jgi:hypothetical protein
MVTPQSAHISGALMAAHCIPADIERKTMNVGFGSLAVNQRRSLNDCFLSKENSSWAQTTTSQQQEAPKK